MSKISLGDIANELGVSKTLVSMVLNDKGDKMGISKTTQEKVYKKAKEMNYRPNYFAQGLRSGKSNTVGLIVSDISNPFYAGLCKAIEQELKIHKKDIIISSTNEDIETEKNLIQMMCEKHVDGLIISSSLSDSDSDSFDVLEEYNVPLVFIDRKLPVKNSSFIGVDNFAGSKEITRHFMAKSLDRIGFLTVGPSYVTSLADRKKGFVEAMKDKVDDPEQFIFEFDFNSFEEEIHSKLMNIIKSNKLQALYTANNNIATTALNILYKNKVIVGKDIDFFSFDDIPLFSLLHPSISAVRQPIKDIGKAAVQMLMNEKEGREEEEILSTELMIRGQ